MNKEETANLMAKNASVDQEAVEATQNILRELKKNGIKSKSLSAQPPTDAYSSAPVSRGFKGAIVNR